MTKGKKNQWLIWVSIKLHLVSTKAISLICSIQITETLGKQMQQVALFTVKLHHRLIDAATESLKVPQMSKGHSSSSVARAGTRQPAALCAWLVLTAGCDCSCYAETSSLFYTFKVLLHFHGGRTRCSASPVWSTAMRGEEELCSWPTRLTACSFEWWFLRPWREPVRQSLVRERQKKVNSPPALQRQC